MQAFSSLPDGGYTLSIQAQDGAGNTNGTPTTRSWTVTAPLGSYAQITVYPRIIHEGSVTRQTKDNRQQAMTGSWCTLELHWVSWCVLCAPSDVQGVNATSGQISFASFVTAAGATPPALQCRVQQESDASDLNVDATSNYTTCTSPQVGCIGSCTQTPSSSITHVAQTCIPQARCDSLADSESAEHDQLLLIDHCWHAQTFSGLADGVYTFSARTSGAYAGYQSSVQFTVGALAPRTSIVAAPVATSSAVTTLKTARFAWVSSGDVTFGCSLVRTRAAGNYSTCVSPKWVFCPDAMHAMSSLAGGEHAMPEAMMTCRVQSPCWSSSDVAGAKHGFSVLRRRL
jgi:hypothetical protein